MSEIVNHKHISKATSDGKRKRYRNGPVTGYILFTSDANPKVRAENPGIPFNELSKLVIFFFLSILTISYTIILAATKNLLTFTPD